MKKLFLILAFLIAFTGSALSTDIDVGASSITGFNTANAGADTSLSGVTVTLGSPNVTCSSCLPTGAVGLSGMKVSLGTPGVVYAIASVASRSAFTLTTNYGESSGTVGGTLYKFVHLRIYVLSPFVPAGSTTVVQSGAPGTTAWYRRYGVSIVNDGAQNVAHVPAIDNLPATTDSSNPTARYYAALYTQGGGFMQSYPGCVDDFRLSHQTTPTSWAQICAFNSPAASPPPQPINFYTTSQIDARFPSCTLNNLDYFAATGNVKSCLALSAEFSISGGVLSLAGPSGVNRVQEDGVDLPQRQKINFGAGLLAADDVGNSRTNVVIDSSVVTLTGSQTLTNKTLTTPTVTSGAFSNPKIISSINDTNNNSLFDLTATVSAVNRFAVANNVTGQPPVLAAVGPDLDIAILLQPKGIGRTRLLSGGAEIAANVPVLRFVDLDNSKEMNIAADNTVWNFNNGTLATTPLQMNTTTDVFTFSQIPVLPASNPTTANQAVRQQYVLDRTTAFSLNFYIGDVATYPLAAFGIGTEEYVVPPGTAITLTQTILTYNAGSASGSFTVTLRKRTGGTSTQTTIATFNITNALAVFGQTTVDINPDFVLTAGDSVYLILDLRSSPLQQSVTVSAHGTQKLIP